MGLFSWLLGKSTHVTSGDVIWLTDSARSRGASQSVKKHVAANRTVLVLAHFPAALAAFGEQIIGSGLPYATIPSELTTTAAIKLAAGEPRVLLGLVRNLKHDEIPPVDMTSECPLPVIVLERHLLRKHDDSVNQFAEGLGRKATVDFHVTLEDPLMELFAGEWVKNMLRVLGMKEGETIDSKLVSRRIQEAQAKLAAKISTDDDANSAEEWLERNPAR